ncbi:MAG TPA: FCD domain-containing protein, partial [Hyphomicrobiaceae bacterium]|nr:FCD domain-containing protein [Hyphomicrobiaceae bacterium]
DADARFHHLLIERCENFRFQTIVGTVNAQAHRVRTLTVNLRHSLKDSVTEHRRIIAAVAAGDAGQASGEARGHRARARLEI